MDALVEDLESKLAAARQGGGSKAAARMRSKGKLLPRERYGRLHSSSVYAVSCLSVYQQASSPS